MGSHKMCLMLAALLVCAGMSAAEKIRIAPGANCYAWSVNTKSKPEGVPNGGFVDESASFSPQNIRQCDELKGISGKAFVMWEGYLKVPADGGYRFTLAIPGGFGAKRTNFKVFVNNQTLLVRNAGDRQLTASAAATLKKGFVKLRIYANPTGSIQAKFLLKFAPASAMKMTDITPATLYHQVETEK